MNQAIHMIDLLCDLMPPVETVTGLTASIGHPGLETEDVGTAALHFQGGALGLIHGSTASWPGYPKRLGINGTRGSAVFVDDRLEVFDFADKRPEDAAFISGSSTDSSGHGASNPAAMTHALHAACFKDFLVSLERGVPFRINGESARRAVAVILAIYESSRTGQHVKLQA